MKGTDRQLVPGFGRPAHSRNHPFPEAALHTAGRAVAQGFDVVGHGIRAALLAIARRWQDSRNLEQLAELSDFHLRDLGITRADLAEVSDQVPHGSPLRALSRIRDQHLRGV